MKTSRLWGALSLALLAVVMAGWLSRPIYLRHREARSIRQAEGFLHQGDYRNAILSLRVALTLNSSNLTATRLMAEVFERLDSPGSLAWRGRLVQIEPSLSNKLVFAAGALKLERRPFAITSQALEELAPAGQSNSFYHVLASELALKLNRAAEAASQLEMAAQLEPANRLCQLNLATVRLQFGQTNEVAAARKALAAFASDPNADVSLPALRSLVAFCAARKEFVAAEDYARQLLARREASFDDSLLELTVLHAEQSAAFKPALEQLWRDRATNSSRLAQVIGWLSAHGQASTALTWAGSLDAARRQTFPVPLAEAECYVRLEDWPGLEGLVAEQKWDEHDYLRRALLARALRAQGRGDAAAANWRLALNAAAGQPLRLAGLLQITEEWGWNDEARDVLWAMAKPPLTGDWPLQRLLRVYRASQETAGLYRVYQALLQRHPRAVEVKNNAAIFGLLLGREPERACRLAGEGYRAATTNVVCASTYAFALYQQGKPAEALGVLEAFPDTELRRPEVAIYYALLLAASGQHDKAIPYLAAAERGRPLPEERALLERARDPR